MGEGARGREAYAVPAALIGDGARRSRKVLGACLAAVRQMRPWEGRNYTAGRARESRRVTDVKPESRIRCVLMSLRPALVKLLAAYQ